MSDAYRKAPSDILGIADPYTAFCLDEACLYIKHMIQEEKRTPNFGKAEWAKEEDKYSGRFTNLYNRIEKG